MTAFDARMDAEVERIARTVCAAVSVQHMVTDHLGTPDADALLASNTAGIMHTLVFRLDPFLLAMQRTLALAPTRGIAHAAAVDAFVDKLRAECASGWDSVVQTHPDNAPEVERMRRTTSTLLAEIHDWLIR